MAADLTRFWYKLTRSGSSVRGLLAFYEISRPLLESSSQFSTMKSVRKLTHAPRAPALTVVTREGDWERTGLSHANIFFYFKANRVANRSIRTGFGFFFKWVL